MSDTIVEDPPIVAPPAEDVARPEPIARRQLVAARARALISVGPERRRSVFLPLRRNVFLILLFAIPGIILWWHVWADPASRLTCACGDSGQEVWFIAWPAYAIAHWQNPLFSTALYSPHGVNLLDNNSSVLVGIVMSPLTWIGGAVFSTNVVVVLAPALSAWAAYLCCRRFTTWRLAAIVPALLYGYSPFVINNDVLGHVADSLLVCPPLIGIVMHELFVRRQWSARRTGASLGVLVVAQFLISDEILAICAVAVAAAVIATLVANPRAVKASLPYVASAVAWGLGVTAVLLAYPFWFAVDGPNHVSGSPFPGIQIEGNRLSDLWNPGHYRAPGFFLIKESGYLGQDMAPDAYLGTGLLALLVISVALNWRRRVVYVLAAVGIFTMACSLGLELIIGQSVHIYRWLPWNHLGFWPFLNEIIPQRFTAVTDLAAVIILAMGLDRARAVTPEVLARAGERIRLIRSHRGFWQSSARAMLMIGFVGALAPVAITEQVPLTTSSLQVPHWFEAAARHLPAHSVVLTYPFPAGANTEPETYQAAEDMPFILAGGYAKVPGPDGHSLRQGPPGSTVRILADLSQVESGPAPTGNVHDFAVLRSSIANWKVDRIVVLNRGRAPMEAVMFFTAVTGAVPTVSEGAWVWTLKHPGDVASTVGRVTQVRSFEPTAPDSSWGYNACQRYAFQATNRRGGLSIDGPYCVILHIVALLDHPIGVAS